jgi:lauroyl/myristoyl acyltransferase
VRTTLSLARMLRSAGIAAPGPASGRPRLLPPRWYAHGFNRLVVYRAAGLAAAALPRPARLRLAVAIAAVVARRFSVERAVVSANVARILPRATPAVRAALVGDVFRNFAMCFADLIAANRRALTLGPLLAGVDGLPHLNTAARSGRGIVVLTAHLGNWELAGRLLALQGGRPTHVVVAADPDPGVEHFLRSAPAPVRFVVRRDHTSALPLLAALRRGEVVAMQGDRALGTRGDVAVPFFGADARFPIGPFVLARAAGVRVVPSFCVLGHDRRYTIEVGDPIDVPPGGEHAALAQWVAVLERVVRAHPEQWFNFFDVWSGAPAY